MVADDGPGIPAKYHQKIFQLFQKLRSETSSQGVGIGLSLVQKQVYSFGGAITVESGPDRGTTFRFSWPKKIAK
jgi:signal transduction histidine kinase